MQERGTKKSERSFPEFNFIEKLRSEILGRFDIFTVKFLRRKPNTLDIFLSKLWSAAYMLIKSRFTTRKLGFFRSPFCENALKTYNCIVRFVDSLQPKSIPPFFFQKAD